MKKPNLRNLRRKTFSWNSYGTKSQQPKLLPINDWKEQALLKGNALSRGVCEELLHSGLGWKTVDILLVDDSKTMRLLVQRAIRQAGYRGLAIEEAENGAQGLEKLTGCKPKIVLSDWNMPEMSGIAFLNQVRAARNTVPFGFITSEASAEIKELAMDSGAAFLITKPFTPEDFSKALTPFLGEV